MYNYDVLKYFETDSLKVKVPYKDSFFYDFFKLEMYKYDEDFIGEMLYFFSLINKFSSALKVFLSKNNYKNLDEFLKNLENIKKENLKDFSRLIKTEIEEVITLKEDLFNRLIEQKKEENIHLLSILKMYLKFLEKINEKIEKVL